MADLGQDCRALSWAPHRPGFQSARRVVWREVRNADLTPDVDPVALLRQGLEESGLAPPAAAAMAGRQMAAAVWASAQLLAFRDCFMAIALAFMALLPLIPLIPPRAKA